MSRFLALVALFGGLSSQAWAEDAGASDTYEDAARALQAEQSRSYRIPRDLKLGFADIFTDQDQRTLIAVTTGDSTGGEDAPEARAACTIVVVDDQGARALSYYYRGGSTGCVGVLPHPEGGFLLRGTRQPVGEEPAEGGGELGFSARLDEEGAEVWALDDQALLDAQSVADGGTGAFRGDYLEAQPELAYDPQNDRLLAFSQAGLRGAANRRLSLGHIIDAGRGELRHSGLAFDISGAPGLVRSALYLADSGDFLVQTGSAAGPDANFFSYNGRRSIQRFRQAGDDWAERTIRQMTQTEDGRLLIMSSHSERPETDLVALDSTGELLWEGSAEQRTSEDVREIPQAFWVSGPYILLYFPTSEGGPRADILALESGESLGQTRFSELSPQGPVSLFSRGGGAFTMLTLELGSHIVHEYLLKVVSAQARPGGGAEPGDAGDDDANDGLIGPSRGSDSGCASAGNPQALPASIPLVALGLIVISFAARRKAGGHVEPT